MSNNLRSVAFRRERQDTWAALEPLVERVEKRGLHSLDEDELVHLARLYRATLSGLSVARAISLDKALLNYLESLAVRAYFAVYGQRQPFLVAAGRFFGRDFPAAVRDTAWGVALSAAFLALGIWLGYFAVGQDSAWFYAFVSADMAGGRVPGADAETLAATLFGHDASAAEMLHVFASILFTHNALIGLSCFALGAAFGIPVAVLMIANGVVIGAMSAVFAEAGLGGDFAAWLSIHGTTELLAVILCGAAGLRMGRAVVMPGPFGRVALLKREGLVAARIVAGSVMLFFCAAVLEGYFRQLIDASVPRAALGAAMAALWAAYFTFAGRRRSDAGRS